MIPKQVDLSMLMVLLVQVRGILGNNMFAYCGNNPVIRVDTSGYGWFDTIKKWIKGIFTNYNDEKACHMEQPLVLQQV